MKNLFFFSMTLLSLSSQISYGQNKAKGSEKLVVDSKQGRSNLDRSKGFGGFIFGTSIKLYKNFKPTHRTGEPSKQYISKIPVIYYGIKIDSTSLDFYRNKLFSITMYVHKSQMQKLISYCLKNYGPRGKDLYDDGSYFWKGKIKDFVFYEVDNDQLEVLFIDNTDSMKRMEESVTDSLIDPADALIIQKNH
ncbi:hypothetical protein ACUN24_20330 [Pedobacter sp. WC2501]|uniref:hypothetical protein n=1 Tax=Pedobacter sp. WC2501 TaxID=3461400 RepID=UPI004045C8A5